MILRDTNGETYFRNEAGRTIHLSENDLVELSKHFAEDPIKEYWKEQIAIHQIELTSDQEEEVLLWLDHYDTDSFDSIGDTIYFAMNDCGIEWKEEYA